MGYRSPYLKNNQLNSFGVKYDKYEKVMYRGQENHFYGRESLGPGAYNSDSHGTIVQSASKRGSSLLSNLSQGDRGLLTSK